jgi:hypothetical protein
MNAPIQKLKIQAEVNADKDRQAQLAIAQGNYAIHKAQFDWQMEERKDNADFQAETVANIQKGLGLMMGDKAPDITTSPQAAKYWIKLLNAPNTPMGKQATSAMLAGQSGVLAGTPAQMLDDIKSNIGVQFPAGQKLVQKLFEDTVTTIQALPPGSEPKNKEQANQMVNGIVAQKLDDYAKNIGKSTDNPLTINNMGQVIQTPEVKDTPLVQKVLAPIADKIDLNNADLVFSTAVAAVNAGTVSQAEAVSGIQAMYLRGKAMNLETNAFIKNGITPSPAMINTYTPEVTVGSLINSAAKSKPNLLNAVSIATAINKAQMNTRLLNTTPLNLNTSSNFPGTK